MKVQIRRKIKKRLLKKRKNLVRRRNLKLFC